jgi:polyhydroxyalkanoate synthesis regulator phasin
VLFELYLKEIIKSISVSREVIDLAKVDQEIADKTKEIIDQMYKGDFSEDQAKEAMRFIKHLTSTLRLKSGRIKEKADSALANIMTAAEESNSIKKLMDFLTN